MQGIIRVFQDTVGFLLSLIRPSAKSIADNRGLFALSVVLAFAIWIFVTDSENPTRTRLLPIDIPVQPVNVGDDVAIADDIPPVRVRITVPDDVFGDLGAGDFEATADLTGYGVGTHEAVPVEVEALTTRGGLRIVDIVPPDVPVQLAQLTSKSVPVEILVAGAQASGYIMTLPELETENVIVSGPQVEVDKVTQARATIDVSSRTESVDQAVRLSPRDSRGFLVQRVNLNPEVVNVRIEITQERFTRSVAISVRTTGSPAPGYNLAGITVDPPTLVVRGDEDFIEDVFSIDTQPIDISGTADDIERTVSLDLPSGVTVPGGAPVVTVSIDIQPSQAEFSFTVPVTVTNLGAGLSLEGAVPNIQVIMTGPQPVLSAIEVNDILATLDLGNLGPGAHTVQVTVSNLPGVQAARAQPSSVPVVINQN
ncbi:MAG TPA: CdaR family protein [Dehalococcoidia bacterium]|nr:CdaR family protein [Dehalococcoidia bacterium]